MEETTLDQSWLYGKLECSFSAEFLNHNEHTHITLNDIVLQGRKVLNDAEFIPGNPPEKESKSFLSDNYIHGLEVFPKEVGIYPLDMARKFNASDIIIHNPQTSEIRLVNGVRHGQLKAELYCKLKKLKDIPLKEEIKVIPTINTDNSILETDLSSRKGCAPLASTSQLMNRNGCMPFGSMLNGPVGGAGCFNFLRLGCGGLIGIILLLGFLSFLFRGCAGFFSDDNRKNDDQEQVIEDDDTDQRKIDFVPEEPDSISSTDDDKTIEYRTVVLSNVQFYTNSSKLMPSSQKDLDKLSLYLLENIHLKARIIGYTDSRGDDNVNKKISLTRAECVRTYIIFQGVDNRRLEAIGEGEKNPRAPNDDAEGRAMNRRVEIELYGKPTAK